MNTFAGSFKKQHILMGVTLIVAMLASLVGLSISSVQTANALDGDCGHSEWMDSYDVWFANGGGDRTEMDGLHADYVSCIESGGSAPTVDDEPDAPQPVIEDVIDAPVISLDTTPSSPPADTPTEPVISLDDTTDPRANAPVISLDTTPSNPPAGAPAISLDNAISRHEAAMNRRENRRSEILAILEANRTARMNHKPTVSWMSVVSQWRRS